MAKGKSRLDFGDMIDLPDDPGPEAVQGNDRTPVHSYDRTDEAVPATPKRRVKVATPEPAEKSSPVYVQRSLYATAETFDKLRTLAFEKRRPIQEFYREGLLMVMRKYGVDGGVKPDNV